jgi:hypothetical protein
MGVPLWEEAGVDVVTAGPTWEEGEGEGVKEVSVAQATPRSLTGTGERGARGPAEEEEGISPSRRQEVEVPGAMGTVSSGSSSKEPRRSIQTWELRSQRPLKHPRGFP